MINYDRTSLDVKSPPGSIDGHHLSSKRSLDRLLAHLRLTVPQGDYTDLRFTRVKVCRFQKKKMSIHYFNRTVSAPFIRMLVGGPVWVASATSTFTSVGFQHRDARTHARSDAWRRPIPSPAALARGGRLSVPKRFSTRGHRSRPSHDLLVCGLFCSKPANHAALRELDGWV